MNDFSRAVGLAAAWIVGLSMAASTGCSGGGSGGAGGNGGASAGAGAGSPTGSTAAFMSDGSNGSGASCTGLQCQIHACAGGGSTTISGTIYDPAGKNPLYGVVAYVPNAPVAPLTGGASCYSCGDLYTGNPIAAAVTDAAGHFTIKDAPDGANIPLVIQVGKWRRQFTLPNVGMCADTPTPDHTLLLPKNGNEGDMPNIAISTGGADSLECLLSRIGVDKSEYSGGAGGPGHIHIFRGTGGKDTSPAAPAPEAGLWDKATDIMQFDIVVLSCEGHETDAMNQQVLYDYAAAGGRVFASHFHYAWFDTGPFANANLATWKTGSNNIGTLNADVVTTTWGGMPFQRGQDMFDWLTNVNALTGGKLPIQAARHNADVSMTNTPSQPWIVADKTSPATVTQDFTFDTPLGAPADKQCGRVAFSDMHVGAASGDYSGNKVTPTGCTDADLSPQEKALEFIFFDLSSCVTPGNIPMQPPGQPPA